MIKDNPSITFNQLIDYKNNTGMETAERFLDDLIAAVEAFPDSTALEAIGVLKQWDKKTEVDSRGAVLFASWWDKVSNNLFKIPWSAENPVTTPDGLKEQKQAVDLLVTAAKEVQAKYGALDIAWGNVYRLNINGIDYPANGGAGDYGIFRTLYFTDVKDSVKIAVAGETFVAVTEFGEKVRARVMLAYGNATQPGNRHIGDQLELLSGKKLREALLDREDILKHLEKRETLTNDFK
jgi:acyl-homoserine-lactone acylase